jgi:uncharacterized phage protein (TIGR02218 family)
VLTLPSGLATHVAGDALSLTYCYLITRSDAVVVRGTTHDADIEITTGTYAGTYKARSAAFASDVAQKSDGSVSNLDMDGAIRVDAALDEFLTADIESGVYDGAEAVLLKLNWAAPADGQKVVMAGWLGEFERDSDGRWRSEVRGLTYALQQIYTRSYSERCDAVFGDARCGFSLAAVQRTCTVTAVTNRRRFVASLDSGPAHAADAYYFGGQLIWTSGNNDGFTREVRCHNVPTTSVDLLLYDEAPADIEVGDTFTLDAACDKLYATCKFVHANLVNFRGHGVFAAGRDRLMQDPKTATAGDLTQQDGNLITESVYDALRADLQALGLTIMGL